MPIVLYQMPFSPPCRAIMMTAEHLGIELVHKYVDLFTAEQMNPEFLAINPQHCVPTIDDDGFYLWESRAILQYLVNEYAPDSPLYPKDPKARAVVDKMLNFDLGNLYKALQNFYRPQMFENRKPSAESEEYLKNSLEIFEKILETSTYAAGNQLTIADYSIFSYAIMSVMLYDDVFAAYPKITAWIERMKKESPKHKEINETPIEQFKGSQFFKDRHAMEATMRQFAR